MLTLKDKLSRLNHRQACKLLGQEGEKRIIAGGKFEIDLTAVTLDRDRFRLDLPEASVSITLDPAKPRRLRIACSCGQGVCDHQGAALALILEEKMSLGLSAPPPESVPVESLSDTELIEQAVAQRAERASSERMQVVALDERQLWTDYTVTSQGSGKTYRVALRGWQRGESFCTCPDFRKNTLGTCKHILHVIDKVRKRFPQKVRETPFSPRQLSVYLRYGKYLELRWLVPDDLEEDCAAIVRTVARAPVDDVEDLLGRIRSLERLGREVIVYPDAEAYIEAQLYRRRSKALMDEIRRDPANHPLRTGLLKVPLLPYQLDGIAFAAGTGRAVLADDMGLGKTIQGVGTAELLSRQADISKVLVICPASLKSQWRAEIGRFSHRGCQLVLGSAKERSEQYENRTFFTICNYEQVLRDILAIERVDWDLIILDEGQRIKNWEAKTSQTIKALRSRFALVLSGTPLENRLEELFSIVEFIDDRRLGPAFRFFHHYRVTDERGKVLGYKNLDDLRQRLKPVMLRRTRGQVMQDLPPRSTEIRRIPPTGEQLEVHDGHKRTISTIVNKRYLSEMDLLRLQKALLMCRMAADSTFLVDKQPPGHSSKLAELAELLAQLAAEEDRKIVLFSEWTTMLNLIEPIAAKVGLQHVRLDGAVPQKKRMALMQQFQRDPQCRLFMATNAGATGLNLQAANTVVNVDLPWNPAVLEQRIARAHRMGQKRPVQIFLLVTESTLEEGLLATLSAKQELFLAALDPDAQATRIDLACGIDELKRRMEILLGARPDAPVDETMKAAVESETASLARREKVAVAGGQLLGAAFAFLGEMFPATEAGAENDVLAEALKDRLAQCLDRDENGALKMTITLPDETVLDNLARSLARIVGSR